MKSSPFRIILSYTLICLIWGTTWFAIKVGLEGVPPILSAAIRFTIASIIFGLIIYISREPILFSRVSIRIYIMLSLMGFTLPFSLVYWGQQYITTGMGAVLFGVYPFLVAIFTAVFLRSEKMIKYKLGGVCIGFAGLIVLFVRDIRFENQMALFGATAVVLSAAIQALNVVLIKKDANNISSTALNFIAMGLAAISLFLLSFTFEGFIRIHWITSTVLSILYLSTFGSVVTFGIYFWLLKRIDTVLLSLSALITPVIAVVVGIIFLDEHLSSDMVFGSLLVLVGILIANWEGMRKLRKAPL